MASEAGAIEAKASVASDQASASAPQQRARRVKKKLVHAHVEEFRRHEHDSSAGVTFF